MLPKKLKTKKSDLVLSPLTLIEFCKRIDLHIEVNNLSLSQVLCDLYEICLMLSAPISELDQHRIIETWTLKDYFADDQFSMKIFEQLDETEQHLLAITDVARMQVQTRAFSAGLWSIIAQYKKKTRINKK